MKAVWHYILVAMIFYGLGEWASKKYANTQSLTFAVWAMLGYTVNALMFLPALTKWNNLAVLGTVWNIGYLFITMALAFFVFHEHVTAKQTCGILLGFAAIYLLST